MITITAFLFLISCSITDIQKQLINSKICLAFLLLGIIFQFHFHTFSLGILIGNVGISIFLSMVSLISKGAIGLGDAIIFFVLSFYLSTAANLVILFYALLAASVYSLILLICKYSRKHAFPFAPFITMGFVLFHLSQFHLAKYDFL